MRQTFLTLAQPGLARKMVAVRRVPSRGFAPFETVCNRHRELAKELTHFLSHEVQMAEYANRGKDGPFDPTAS
jgi:hypothetical protein